MRGSTGWNGWSKFWSRGAMVTPGDDEVPDIVGRYNWSGDWGSLTAAAIVRRLHVSADDLMGGDDAAWGYSLSLSGKLNDAAIMADGTPDPIFTWSGFAAYRHVGVELMYAASLAQGGNVSRETPHPCPFRGGLEGV